MKTKVDLGNIIKYIENLYLGAVIQTDIYNNIRKIIIVKGDNKNDLDSLMSKANIDLLYVDGLKKTKSFDGVYITKLILNSFLKFDIQLQNISEDSLKLINFEKTINSTKLDYLFDFLKDLLLDKDYRKLVGIPLDDGEAFGYVTNITRKFFINSLKNSLNSLLTQTVVFDSRGIDYIKRESGIKNPLMFTKLVDMENYLKEHGMPKTLAFHFSDSRFLLPLFAKKEVFKDLTFYQVYGTNNKEILSVIEDLLFTSDILKYFKKANIEELKKNYC